MRHGLMVHNTMTMRKERFERPERVKMFVCGPTVQNLIHVGHARTYVFYDVVARYLAHIGHRVDFIVNITDIDDRITEEAKASGMDPEDLARKYTDAFLEDMGRLKITSVTSFERVSKYVDVMIGQVSALLEGKHAYVADGVVYFDTSTFPRYGRLSHQSKAELSLRPLELSPNKRNLLDFGLWRPVVLLEGRWDSPWGRGSPGWHIQDTAVSLSNFGTQYDIHGGAYELIYPHHEAEIAQAESITGVRPLVRYWVHTGLINTKGRKMSKSAGNVFSVRDILKRHSADQLRFYLLSKHYREDMDFGLAHLRRESSRFSKLVVKARKAAGGGALQSGPELAQTLAPFYEAMDDDFDTPKALEWVEDIVVGARVRRDSVYSALLVVSEVLGIGLLGEV
jgi:cysteinyl-tRNA synthetase